jgi:hypothetical protein
MTIQLVRKPPIGHAKTERLLITFAGNHTLKQKAAMLLQAKYWLEHEQNVGHAGLSSLYLQLVDQWGHPLTHFADGTEIANYNLVIDSPYHCAADHYGA